MYENENRKIGKQPFWLAQEYGFEQIRNSRSGLPQHEPFPAERLNRFELVKHVLHARRQRLLHHLDVVGRVRTARAEHSLERRHALLERLVALRGHVEYLCARANAGRGEGGL